MAEIQLIKNSYIINMDTNSPTAMKSLTYFNVLKNTSTSKTMLCLYFKRDLEKGSYFNGIHIDICRLLSKSR